MTFVFAICYKNYLHIYKTKKNNGLKESRSVETHMPPQQKPYHSCNLCSNMFAVQTTAASATLHEQFMISRNIVDTKIKGANSK